MSARSATMARKRQPRDWIPIRPNTDTAMLLALVHTLVAEQLHDQAFLARHCVGFERVLPYLTGASDGQVKDADWAAAITGVPAETIRALARRMAQTRTMVSASWSLQRADHGEQPYWAVILLASALGQIGLPGGGFGFGYGSTSGIAEPPLAFGPPAMEVLANPLGRAIPAARIADCLLDPGGTYDYNGKSGTYPDIRLVYWAGGNPFHHHQDLNRLRRAWQRPETIIVHEPWWTATARHADIVLPATTTLERNDIGAAHRDRYVLSMQQAIAPVGQARSDFAIFADARAPPGVRARLYAGSRRDGVAAASVRSLARPRAHQPGGDSRFRRLPQGGLCRDPAPRRRIRVPERFPRRSGPAPPGHALGPHRALFRACRRLRLR